MHNAINKMGDFEVRLNTYNPNKHCSLFSRKTIGLVISFIIMLFARHMWTNIESNDISKRKSRKRCVQNNL
jgi:hypothetical protein